MGRDFEVSQILLTILPHHELLKNSLATLLARPTATTDGAVLKEDFVALARGVNDVHEMVEGILGGEQAGLPPLPPVFHNMSAFLFKDAAAIGERAAKAGISMLGEEGPASRYPVNPPPPMAWPKK